MNAVPLSALPQCKNGVRKFSPVARIVDMLLHPGTPFDYNGARYSYPDVRLVYWAGGNPFHHHQDINRLRRAFAQVETLVVHETAWTATARHADIVLPCTMTLEREDIGGTQTDPLMIAMHRLAEPFGEARDDYAIFTELAERLGCAEAFTEGRSVRQWLQHLYSVTQDGLAARGFEAPDFDSFWQRGELLLPQRPHDGGILRVFRGNPEATPLPTPSGKIEIFSQTIAGFGYPDCPGHPAWLPPADAISAAHPLQLVANQPATRLHSQFDFGGHSAALKHRGREVARLHPIDAAARGIAEGDIIKLFNQRGACLAAAVVTEDIRAGVVQLPTGAWYDPQDPEDDMALCVHGNPNVLTRDVGTSSLQPSCCGQLTTAEPTGEPAAVQARFRWRSSRRRRRGARAGPGRDAKYIAARTQRRRPSDQAIQYFCAQQLNRRALAYWATRFRGWCARFPTNQQPLTELATNTTHSCETVPITLGRSFVELRFGAACLGRRQGVSMKSVLRWIFAGGLLVLQSQHAIAQNTALGPTPSPSVAPTAPIALPDDADTTWSIPNRSPL
jgi:hypothetical protein